MAGRIVSSAPVASRTPAASRVDRQLADARRSWTGGREFSSSTSSDERGESGSVVWGRGEDDEFVFKVSGREQHRDVEALPDDLRARVDAHLEICPGCPNAIAQLRTVVDLTGRLTESDVEDLDPLEREALLSTFRRLLRRR